MPPIHTAINPPLLAATEPLLRVRDLHVSFKLDEGTVRAVDGLSFDVFPGQVVGIVGESGCGKSVTMKAVLQLVEWVSDGRIKWRDHVVEGLEQAPRALNMLFTGENTGKLMVRVGPDPTA